jgi:restriction system protein
MAIWLTRAGSHGEFEQKFIQENRVYVTWDGLNIDISKLSQREGLFQQMEHLYPSAKQKQIQNWVGQVWPFAHIMKKGDWVVLPLKSQPAIQIGEITSDYQYNPEGPDPYYHYRTVEWIGEAIPRPHFGQDLLYSFGAFLTICRVKRNNAEDRLIKMRANDWKPEKISDAIVGADVEASDEESDYIDLELLAQDQIAQLISARFKGHSFTRLVDAVLRAQGYTTYVSPEGADGGVDILAGAGQLGFGQPRLCVEVKSSDSPIDRPNVDKLMGAITKFGAQEGLFVSWGGFKSNVFKEMALFANFDRLDDEIKAELPLKRIWMVASSEDED